MTPVQRAGGVTSKGTPPTVRGAMLELGQKAPAFALITNDLSAVSLSESAGKARLISVVPSLDTCICDA